jgi:16S rRNA (guanine966-N2)-methyltransferase
MKIAGGKFKGRILKAPKSAAIRPSTEKIRDANIADLFCGTGALGLEALSRGASTAIFVDSDKGSSACTRENIKALGLENCARVLTMNVFHIRPNILADIGIIFADPPYKNKYADRIINLLSLQNFAWNGILVMEHESEWNYKGEEFELLKRISFGDSAVSIMMGPKREPSAKAN